MCKTAGAHTLEDALNKVGTGPFQWRMLAMCGLANAADAVEIMCVGLVATAADKELRLTPSRVGVLNASTLVGMFVGAIVWGLLSDTLGRRKTLMAALLINFVFALLSAAASSYWQLALLRLLAGLGVGGSMPIVFTQMSEFCSTSARGRFMAMTAAFWMVGSLYSALVGWLVIIPWGWRAFVVLTTAPAAMCLVAMYYLMPESPRFLLARARAHDATQVLRLVAAVNGVTLPPDFGLITINASDTSGVGSASSQPLMDGTDEEDGEHARLISDTRHMALWLSRGGNSSGAGRRREYWLLDAAKATWLWGLEGTRCGRTTLAVLLLGPLRRQTWPLMVAWIGLCGGWYSTMLWLPSYFEMQGASGSSLYAQTFAVALANLPGNIASVWLVDWLGRRVTTCLCMAGACACALLFAAAPASGSWPLAAACVFNAISVGGWNSLDLISAELYPTQVRASGFGLLNGTGRIASFVTTYLVGHLIKIRMWAPLVLAAVLLAVGSVAMMVLPEPAGKPLEDTVQEDDSVLPNPSMTPGCLPWSRGSVVDTADVEKVGLLTRQAAD